MAYPCAADAANSTNSQGSGRDKPETHVLELRISRAVGFNIHKPAPTGNPRLAQGRETIVSLTLLHPGMVRDHAFGVTAGKQPNGYDAGAGRKYWSIT